MRWLLLLLASALLGCPASQPGSGPGVEVRLVRLAAPAGDAAAVYLVAEDVSGAGDRLVGAHSAEAARVMLHRTRHAAGHARMEPVDAGIVVPAGGRAVLAPGGAHVMLMGLERRFTAGDELALVLHFENAGELPVRARVVDPAELEALFEEVSDGADVHGHGAGSRP